MFNDFIDFPQFLPLYYFTCNPISLFRLQSSKVASTIDKFFCCLVSRTIFLITAIDMPADGFNCKEVRPSTHS
jgi:hypothetical protein